MLINFVQTLPSEPKKSCGRFNESITFYKDESFAVPFYCTPLKTDFFTKSIGALNKLVEYRSPTVLCIIVQMSKFFYFRSGILATVF